MTRCIDVLVQPMILNKIGEYEGDTVKADYSSVKWKQAPQWARHNQISNEQIRDME